MFTFAVPTPKFSLGQLVATPGALMAFDEAKQSTTPFVRRHAAGDWGEVDGDDWKSNNWAVDHGCRLMSAYVLRTGIRIWIITEADRSSTTVLLPDEY
jgi:hypothetical protein